MKKDQTPNEKQTTFLSELRSGKYTKGCIKSDEKTGLPICEKTGDFAENTACSCAIMGMLFGKTKSGKISLPKAMKALNLNSNDCRFIQREINDRVESTLEEDAEIIETLFFNKEKFDIVYDNVMDRMKKIAKNDFSVTVAPAIEMILIDKIIYDFKNSGNIIKI